MIIFWCFSKQKYKPPSNPSLEIAEQGAPTNKALRRQTNRHPNESEQKSETPSNSSSAGAESGAPAYKGSDRAANYCKACGGPCKYSSSQWSKL